MPPVGALRVLLCGTGAASHILAAVLSTQSDVDVCVFTQNPSKALAWRQVLQRQNLTVTVTDTNSERLAHAANSFFVTSDPEQAAHGRDLIILSLPAFMHSSYLLSLAPHLEQGCVIVGLPGQCGFEFEVRHILRQRFTDFCIVNFDSLPWICQIVTFGSHARITGTKEVVVGAIQHALSTTRIAEPLRVLQHLLGKRPPQLIFSGHVLGITLRSPNASSHPAIMYSKWRNWNGVPLEQPPLFYRTIDEETASILTEISREVVATARHIMTSYPDVDLSQVVPMHEWDLQCYGPAIKDKSSLMSAIRTNSGYANIKHPMIQVADKQFIPDYGHRFLTEDIPFGLAVLRGISAIVGTSTVNIDRVLYWGQERLGRQYLTRFGMTGQDLETTRCPQRYGLTTLDELLGYV